ncbi:hypothetical protein GOODEAATRI_026472, partial [Goodea atripinnis]
VFQVAYIIIKAANSPRPGKSSTLLFCLSVYLSVYLFIYDHTLGNWILERSLDGVTFDPWQYYAIGDSECLSRYNVTPRLGPPTYRSDIEVICTSYYSRLNPLEHGEIHTSLINGRPGADDLTPDLLNFTSARYIRLRLQRIRTLNADLMTLSIHDPRDIDPIVTRRVNVMGVNCDVCKPGFYNLQQRNPLGCTDCFCFGVSNVCESSALSITQLVSYGGLFIYSVVYDVPLDNKDQTLPVLSDVIMEGNGRSLRLSPPLLLFVSPLAEQSVSVEMFPQQFVDDQTGGLITRDDLLLVLTNLTSLLVRVHLNTSAQRQIGHVYQGSTELMGFCLEETVCSVNVTPIPPSVTSVESVRCTSGFYGNPQVMGGACVSCECNGNVNVSEAGYCDTVTGECLRCLGNTAGKHCEVCRPGYYGDAVLAKDCKSEFFIP